MINELNWKFKKGDRGYDGGNGVDLNFPSNIEAVLREGIQNAVDAKIKKADYVEVDIELIILSGEEKNQYLRSIKWDDLSRHIKSCVDDPRNNTSERGRKLASGLKQIKKSNQDLLLLKISDYNTTGLFGYEDSDDESVIIGVPNPFEGLMRSHLGSDKNDIDSGGSFGMGKASYIGVSGINTYFCNSVINEDETRDIGRDTYKITDFTNGKSKNRILGRSDITSHKLDSDSRKREGFFGTVKDKNDLNEEVDSFFDENSDFIKNLYLDRKDGSGTTVLIPALFTSGNINEPDTRTTEDLFKYLQQMVVKNFWPAIVRDSLHVNVTVTQDSVSYTENKINPSEAQFLPNLSKLLSDNLEMLKNPHSSFKNIVEEGDIKELDLPNLISNSDNNELELSINFKIPSTRVLDKKDEAHKHSATDHDTGLLMKKIDNLEDLSELERELKNSIAAFRHPGMVVEYINQFSIDEDESFLGLIACGTFVQNDDDARIADRFLKYLEPPHHDTWNPRHEQVKKWKMFYRENTFRSAEQTAVKAFDTFKGLIKSCVESIFQEKVEIPDEVPETIKKLGNINFGSDPIDPPPLEKGISRREIANFNKDKSVLTREIEITFPENIGNGCTLSINEVTENFNGSNGDNIGFNYIEDKLVNAKIDKTNYSILKVSLSKEDRVAKIVYEVNFPDQNLDTTTLSTQSEILLRDKNV